MKSSSKINSLLLWFLSFFLSTYPCGFARETLVKTPTGYTRIETVRIGDEVVSFDGAVNRVTEVIARISDDCVQLVFPQGAIIVDREQRFYCGASWRSIGELMDVGEFKTLKNLIECAEAPPTLLFDLVVEPDHCFYVTINDIAVHNFIECAAAGPVITLSGCSSGAAIIAPIVVPVGVGITVLWMLGKGVRQRLKRKQQQKDAPKPRGMSQQPVGGAPQEPEDPDGHDPDNQDFFKKLKARADKVARSKRFGKMYHDPITDRWWSKDRAGHGGSRYKVFRKVAKGFEWVCDAAADGTEIVGKHKGPVGGFIPNKEVNFS